MSSDIRIQTNVLAQHDYKTASAAMQALDNVIVVEMMPIPKRISGIIVATHGDEGRLRDDIGRVMAADPRLGIVPGTYVACKYKAGISYRNFAVGKYKAKNEVRIYGRTQTTGSNNYKIEKFSPSNFIHGTIKVNMFDIDFVMPRERIPITKRLSIDTYESYVRVHRDTHESHKLDGKWKFMIGDPIGTGVNSVELEPGKAYRVTVKNCGGSVFQTMIEVIGDDSLEFAYCTDRELPIQAKFDKLIVELDEIHDQSVGGIYLPDNEASRNCKATVLSVGSKCDREISIGDRVLITPGSSGQRVHQMINTQGICNKSLAIVPDSAVVIILRGEKNMTKKELDRIQESA